MCLYVKTTKPSIAEEDIVCYKVLEYFPRVKQYLTPFTNYPMKIGDTLHDYKDWEIRNVKMKTKLIRDTYDWALNMVGFIDAFSLNAGGFHTYEAKEDAKNCARELSFNSTIVVKCIIPKGTEYFEGGAFLHGYFVKSYASKNLKLIEIVEHYGGRD